MWNDLKLPALHLHTEGFSSTYSMKHCHLTTQLRLSFASSLCLYGSPVSSHLPIWCCCMDWVLQMWTSVWIWMYLIPCGGSAPDDSRISFGSRWKIFMSAVVLSTVLTCSEAYSSCRMQSVEIEGNGNPCSQWPIPDHYCSQRSCSTLHFVTFTVIKANYSIFKIHLLCVYLFIIYSLPSLQFCLHPL